MAAEAMVTARMPQGKKDAANSVLSSLGITASQAINDFYDLIIERGALPFERDAGCGNVIDPAEYAKALEWVEGLALPADNRFSTMTDDEIRRERLAVRGLL